MVAGSAQRQSRLARLLQQVALETGLTEQEVQQKLCPAPDQPELLVTPRKRPSLGLSSPGPETPAEQPVRASSRPVSWSLRKYLGTRPGSYAAAGRSAEPQPVPSRGGAVLAAEQAAEEKAAQEEQEPCPKCERGQ